MSLKIHFLTVGHGDCTFVEHPSGRLTMIDINNSKSLPEDDVEALAKNMGVPIWQFRSGGVGLVAGHRSWASYYESLLVDPLDFYEDNFSNQTIFRYIQTHPDMDHMSGLYRFFWQAQVGLQNFWDTAHNKSMDESDFDNSQYEYVDWLTYSTLRKGIGPDAATRKALKKLRGNMGQYWTDDAIEVLSPDRILIDACNTNDTFNDCSYVLKISHAGRSVVLPGDAEIAAWSSVLEAFDPGRLACNVLKAAHHGRESGYHKDAVNAMSPDTVICSVGKKPSTDASDEYAGHGAKVFSTRYHGTITVHIWDDGDIWITDHDGDRIHTIS